MNYILEKKYFILTVFCLIVVSFFVGRSLISKDSNESIKIENVALAEVPTTSIVSAKEYDDKVLSLLHTASSAKSTSTKSTSTSSLWPTKSPRPIAGAILPFKRVVAYYGNLYSTRMGVLGQYPADEMLRRLNVEVKKWESADPETPVQPALHYIVTTAQESAGKDKKYRLRMPDSEIDKVIKLAEKANAIVFLDFQVALSNVQTEIPVYEKYLKMPQVHLGLDPEFSMKGGQKPGTVIGTMNASDINYAANYLAKIVKENNLPPKILVIHRFTEDMVTGYKKITPLPEVQIVMDMDGWGFKAKKINTYKQVIYSEPVQFTGFKLFYKNDVKGTTSKLMTPAEVLKLSPKPIYIQYQ